MPRAVSPSRYLVPLLESPWRERDAETARAVRQALPLIATGAWRDAAFLIEYAQRRAAADGTLTFALAELYLLTGNPRAADMFAFLADKTGWGEALRRLAVFYWSFGEQDAAATMLACALGEHAPPPDEAFHGLAGEIAGARGWCGLSNDGFVTLVGPAKCEILLDGVKAAGRRVAGRGFRLAEGWEGGASLTVRAGADLCGSPIDVRRVTRVEGFVEARDGGVGGWCWLPAEPWQAPVVRVGDREIVADVRVRPRIEANPFAEPRGFFCPAGDLGGEVVDVRGPHGKRLYGAPLTPRFEEAGAAAAARALAAALAVRGDVPRPVEGATFLPVRADVRGPPPAHPMPDLSARRVLVVIPVYLGLQPTMECLQSVAAARDAMTDVLVVVDGSPDRALVAKLRDSAGTLGFTLEILAENQGFPAAANVGLRAADGRDVVLLNSDTLVPPGWISALRCAIYSANDIGTATPFSNSATIFSYPVPDHANPIPDLAQTAEAAGLAREANHGIGVEVPTAHGFCMYIRAECLADTGLLRADLFAQGYGEENDFSLRARHLGWRHVAAADAYVAHRESVSFGAARPALIERNLAILNRLHPGYEMLIESWAAADPLFEARRRMDMIRWRRAQKERRTVLIVSHDRGGGVTRYVLQRAREIERDGLRAMILRPTPRGVAIDNSAFPNLVFAIDEAVFEEFLDSNHIGRMEIHHTLGHDPALIDYLIARVPVYDVMVHDYAWYCPRITLTARDDRYCGEPDVSQCAFCVADYGTELEEPIGPADLHRRSLRILQGARAVIAPSQDAARRYMRRFGIKVQHTPLEDERAPLSLRAIAKPPGALRRIVVAGAISMQKGYELLLQAARLVAAKKLPLEFIVVGFTTDDDRLLATGAVRITGPYPEEEVVAIIQAQDADFAFLPAHWPETWSYVLSQIWQAGLPVIALDIGAPAERIKARNGGMVVPAHLPVERLLSIFMEPGLFRAR